ncbi:MAG: arginine deiminase-related protein [Steroidobacteraceae bacterium]
MVRPAAFGFNSETAASNALQQPPAASTAADHVALARNEFDLLVAALRAEGIRVDQFDDATPPVRPDAVFPNNWLSLHADGTAVLYPLLAANRRLERRRDILDTLVSRCGFAIRRVVDLSPHECDGEFLEGTGSLVLDHPGRKAYMCRSGRSHETLARRWGDELGYEVVAFDAVDARGFPYYHTNVMLSIGTHFVVVCAEAVAASQRDKLLQDLAGGGRVVVPIDRDAVTRFAANILELASWEEGLGDVCILAMSARARDAFDENRYALLRGQVDAVMIVPLDCIETVGGGGLRCMLAENFLPGPVQA